MSRLQKSYNTFVVQATAIPLREPEGSFTVHVDIRKDNGNYTDETHFESGGIFSSENAALEGGFRIGKEKIDTGFQPKSIVTNLDETAGVHDLTSGSCPPPDPARQPEQAESGKNGLSS